MKATELRIGNYVAATNDEVQFPYIITAKEIVFCDSDDSRFNPIPLNKDWLIKLGFDKYNSTTYLCVLDMSLKLYVMEEEEPEAIMKWHLSVEDYSGDEERDDNQMYLTQIDFVHQLQNLCFALTGVELSIVR